MLSSIRKIDITSCHETQDHWFAGFRHGFHQIQLNLRQLQSFLITGSVAVSSISFFALQRLIKSHAQDHHIAVCCNDLRLSKPVLGKSKVLGAVTEKITANRTEDAYIVSKIVLKTLLDGAVAGSGAVVVSNQSRPAVCVWSYNSNCFDLILLQRKDSVVFQKYEALLGSFLGKCQMSWGFYL